jgi:hypothetical protein
VNTFLVGMIAPPDGSGRPTIVITAAAVAGDCYMRVRLRASASVK